MSNNLTGPVSPQSPNFTWQELTTSRTATTLGVSNIPTDDVARNLQQLCDNYLQPLRNEFGPLHINSAYRAPMVNQAVGGAPDSWHLRGCAADVRLPSALVGCQMVTYLHRRFTTLGIGYDELLLSRRGQQLWLHLAYNPREYLNRLRCRLISYAR